MPDPGGPLTFEIMADDTIAYIEAIGTAPSTSSAGVMMATWP